MAKKANGRGKSWQRLSREVDKAAGLTGVKGEARKAMGPKTARAMATHFPGHKSAKPRKGGKPKPPAGLVAELRDSAKAKRGEIETLTARINQLAEICTDGVDNVRQGDLRFGQEVEGAAHVLGKTAKTIEEAAMDAGRNNLSDSVDALPSEVHEFEPSGKRDGDECALCGDDKRSLIHATKLEPHSYIPATEDDSSCGVCDSAGFVGSSDDAIHGAAALAAQGLQVAEEMPNGKGKGPGRESVARRGWRGR